MKKLIAFLGSFFIAAQLFAATEFICTLGKTGADYTTFEDWENAIACDLTAAGTKTFKGLKTGAIADGASVTLYRGGSSQSVTAIVQHANSKYILLKSISNTSFSYQVNDQWRVDASNYFAIATTGDSAIAVMECYNDLGTHIESWQMNNTEWAANDTNKIILRPAPGERHNGTSSTGFTWQSVADNSCLIFQYNSMNVVIDIDGIVFKPVSSGDQAIFIYYIGDYNRITVKNCVIDGAGNSVAGIAGTDGSTWIVAYNNVFIGCMSGYWGGMRVSFSTATVYNNTFYNNDCGIRSESVGMVAKNNAAFGNAIHGDYLSTENFAAESANNLSSDGTGDDFGTGGLANKTIDATSDVVSLTAGSLDLHIKGTSSDLYNTGVDVYGDARLAITNDIDVRAVGVRNDIGANEYINHIYKTVQPTGGDYTCLEDAVHAQTQDLVSNNAYVDIEIKGTWSSPDTTPVDMDGYTTDIYHYINIRTDDANKFKGKWDTTKYRLSFDMPYAVGMLHISADYAKVTGLQIRNLGTYAGGGAVGVTFPDLTPVNNKVELNDMLVIAAQMPMRIWCDYVHVYAKNCVFYNPSSDDGSVWGYGEDHFFYNCIFISSSPASSAISRTGGGTWTIKNCYAASLSPGINAYDGGTVTTSASNDTSGSTGLQNIDCSTSTGANFSNLADGSEDFRLQSGSSLIDVGADLTSDAGIAFITDVEGGERDAFWDIGPDEYGVPAQEEEIPSESQRIIIVF